MQRELTATTDHQTEMTTKIHDLEKENIILKNRAEEVTQKQGNDFVDLGIN